MKRFRIPIFVYALTGVVILHAVVLYGLHQADPRSILPQAKPVNTPSFQVRTIHYVDPRSGSRSTERRFTVSTRLAQPQPTPEPPGDKPELRTSPSTGSRPAAR